MVTDYSKDFNFITDRLAIGSLASRSTPGFVAVVSVVTVEGRHRGRPWADDQTDIWEGKLKEAKNALAAWRRRRQSAEKDLSQPLHPHLVDNCNPSPESDEL